VGAVFEQEMLQTPHLQVRFVFNLLSISLAHIVIFEYALADQVAT
jgi:hypothetical protein